MKAPKPEICPNCRCRPTVVYDAELECIPGGELSYLICFGCNDCLEYSVGRGDVYEEAKANAIMKWNDRIKTIRGTNK